MTDPKDQFSPQVETYVGPPKFKHTLTQRNTDFAQLVASGCHPADAIVRASIVTASEAHTTPRNKLYAMASRLMRSEAIQERMDYFAQLHRESMSITAERIHQETAAVAFADVAQAFDHDTGAPITNPHDLPRHLRAAIKEFRVDKDGVVHIKFHDKMKAVQMAGDMAGVFDEARRASAPQVTVNLGGESLDPVPTAIDVTPTMPECLE